ncbi:MAG: SGNH/GDSL hydrolase family protein [Legionellaceae bacterium]|nr:SGNH/GDSL hydrolase family protein [Legionellaceae bacterium]
MVRCSLKAVLMGFVLCVTAVSAMATPLKGFVAFGDSLSDNGNLYEYMKHQLPLSPPYYQGRFSNGPVWIEHLVASYYPTNATSHMLNYAFGGSGVAEQDEDEINDGAMLTLDSQVDSYLLAHDKKANESSLYTIWTGSNNYLGLPDDVDAEVSFVVGGIRRNAEKLIDKGAKHVMLIGIPDLGRIPMATEFEATAELSLLANTHNAMLEAEVKKLQIDYPEVEWVFFPVNNMFQEALDYPEHYGFTNTTGTCYETLETIPSPQSVLSMASRIKPRSARTSICDEYLFFDPVHPSARGHEYIALEARKLLDATGVEFE